MLGSRSCILLAPHRPAQGGTSGSPLHCRPLFPSPRRHAAAGAGRRKPARPARTAAAGPPLLLPLRLAGAASHGVGWSRRGAGRGGAGKLGFGVSAIGSGSHGGGSATAAAQAPGLRPRWFGTLPAGLRLAGWRGCALGSAPPPSDVAAGCYQARGAARGQLPGTRQQRAGCSQVQGSAEVRAWARWHRERGVVDDEEAPRCVCAEAEASAVEVARGGKVGARALRARLPRQRAPRSTATARGASSVFVGRCGGGRM
jgi:hypothetical protein